MSKKKLVARKEFQASAAVPVVLKMSSSPWKPSLQIGQNGPTVEKNAHADGPVDGQHDLTKRFLFAFTPIWKFIVSKSDVAF